MMGLNDDATGETVRWIVAATALAAAWAKWAYQTERKEERDAWLSRLPRY